MVGGKVALSDDCCCGGAGACCLDGVCTSKTAAECAAIGGEFHAGVSCDPNPCCDVCPDPNAPTITVIFTAITLCAPRTGDVNGTFVLTNTAPGIWQANGNSYTDGGDTFATFIEVDCTSNVMAITMLSEDGFCQNVFVSSNACPPGPVSNNPASASCDPGVGACAEGGTAGISP